MGLWPPNTLVTRMRSSRMHTARALPYKGVSLTEKPSPDREPPKAPWTGTPPDRDPPGQRQPPDRDPLDIDPPPTHTHTETPLTETPLAPWSCDLWWMLGQRPPPPVNRITDACENITFAATSLRAVKISQTLDGYQRRPHRFHFSCPLLTRPLDALLALLTFRTWGGFVYFNWSCFQWVSMDFSQRIVYAIYPNAISPVT